MTRRYPWALGCASLLTILSISFLTVTSLAQAITLDERQKACSEGCHEAREEPRPEWHPDIGDRGTAPASEPQQPEASGALTATSLALAPSSRATAGEPVNLMASLHDGDGDPVPGAEIHFHLEAEFAGTQGLMEIGVARTDGDGEASLEFVPAVAQQKQVIIARFEGTRSLAESEQRVEIASVGSLVAAYVTAPVGLEAVGQWALAAFVAAVLGVWAAFGYILYQGFAIWRGA